METYSYYTDLKFWQSSVNLTWESFLPFDQRLMPYLFASFIARSSRIYTDTSSTVKRKSRSGVKILWLTGRWGKKCCGFPWNDGTPYLPPSCRAWVPQFDWTWGKNLGDPPYIVARYWSRSNWSKKFLISRTNLSLLTMLAKDRIPGYF